MAVPAIFNNITVPLLGLSDTAISGHLGYDSFLAAMAVGAMMFNVIFMLCGFLRMGTTGLSALANGAGNAAMTRDVLRKSVVIAASIGAAVLIFHNLLAELLLRLISPDTNVAEEALRYFNIVVWSVPPQLAVMACSGWFIGCRNTLIPMIVGISVNIVNIALSVISVFGLGYGFAGIAFGTLAANWFGLFLMLFFVVGHLRRMATTGEAGRQPQIDGKVGWGRFFRINTNLFFRSACIMAVSLTMTAVGARLGETTLAANSVMLQFFIFFSYFMDGFAFAGEALVGNAAGASDKKSLHATVAALVRWGVGLSISFALIYFLCGKPIVSRLTDSDAVRLAVSEMSSWLVALPVVTVWAFIFDGVFIGLARTAPLLVATLIASSVFATVIFAGHFVSAGHFNDILWGAFETYLLLRGVLLAGKYLKLRRKSLIL